MRGLLLIGAFFLLVSFHSSEAVELLPPVRIPDPFVPSNCHLTQCFPKGLSSKCRRGTVRKSVHPCRNPREMKEMCCRNTDNFTRGK